MKKFLFALALCLILAIPAAAARYENARFGYRVDVPEDFEWLPEAANGDGRVFRHKDEPRFTFTFYARVQQPDQEDTLTREGAARIPPGASEVNALESGPSYYVSFVKGGLYTDALIFLVDGVFYLATAQWPKSRDGEFQPLSGKVLRTWKIHGNPTVY